MDKLTETQAEALKSSVEEKLRQFYVDLDEIFKAYKYNITGLNDAKPLSAFQKDESLEDKKEIKDDEQNKWAIKILLTSKEMSNKSSKKVSKDKPYKLLECKVVSLIPLEIKCD